MNRQESYDSVSQTQQAMEMVQKIVNTRNEIEARILKLLNFKKQIQQGKASLRENISKNEKVLQDFQEKIVKKIQSEREAALKEITPNKSSKNEELVSKVKDRESAVHKELTNIQEDQEQIDYLLNEDDQPHIKIIKFNYIGSNEKRQKLLQKYTKEEKEHELTAVEYDINISTKQNWDKAFVSVSKVDTIDIDF